MILTRRIYGYDDHDKYFNVLVDRLWPRGIPKNEAIWNEWFKELAPTSELRKWFGHEPKKWKEFKESYKIELAKKPEEIMRLKDVEKEHGTIVLLYAAKDSLHNNAVALLEMLTKNEI